MITLRNRQSPRVSLSISKQGLVGIFGWATASALVVSTAQATLIVSPANPGDYHRLAGGQSVKIYDGVFDGPVVRMDISFFFSPGTEIAQIHSRASDFAVVIVSPTGASPLQWGGADAPFQSLFPGAVHMGNWSFHGPDSGGLDSGGSPNYDKTYTDMVLTGLGGLTGSGNWQVYIMNAYTASQDVYYQDVTVTLYDSWPSTSVPEGFAPAGLMACFAGAAGLLGFCRTRQRAAK